MFLYVTSQVCSNFCVCLLVLQADDVGLEKVTHLLHGHTGRVNCVRWVSNTTSPTDAAPLPDASLSPSCPLLVSGAADNKVMVWKSKDFDDTVSTKGQFRVKFKNCFIIGKGEASS